MGTENRPVKSTEISRLVTIVLGLPWVELITEGWKLGRKILRGLANEGMYEVLDCETTLELFDRKGERAKVKKREKVRYLQDYILAYQDQAWGDGKILLNYKCSPGKPVDRYRPGKKTYVLISLRGVKRRGDVDDINIEWDIRNGFIRSTELWETEIRHRTKPLKIQLIFPKIRPPIKISLVEGLRNQTTPLSESEWKRLPDGRWLISWGIQRPSLYEQYRIQWEW
jgi:hypothetical protein